MGEFRICQFSIQGNHIHLICEASDNARLARGIQGWSVRVARGINGHLGREGSVFDDRYHVAVLTTPTQTRHALCYVLQNARRHGERLDSRFGGMDPFSSAWWFDGWKDERWKLGIPPPEMRTVAPAESWLLMTGWKRAIVPTWARSVHECTPCAPSRARRTGRTGPEARASSSHCLSHPVRGAPKPSTPSAADQLTRCSHQPGRMPSSRTNSGISAITNTRPAERVGANGCEASRKYIAVTIRR
jgi:hypothetical protein